MKLFLRSSQADYHDKSTGIWIFRKPLTFHQNTTKLRVQLRSLTFYNVFQSVTATNNRLDTSLGSFMIPAGQWDATSLASFLSTTIANDIEVTFEASRLHFVFEGTITVLSTSTCLALLGFTIQDHSSVNGVLESDKLCDLSTPVSIDVSVNLLLDNLDTVNRSVGSNLLAQVPVTGGYGDVVSYFNTTAVFSETSETLISYMKVSLAESVDGSALDLQNTPWSAVLILEPVISSAPQPDLRGIINDFFSSQQVNNGRVI